MPSPRTSICITLLLAAVPGCVDTDEQTTQANELAAQPFYVFADPPSTTSYVPSASSPRFAFNWDARLIFSAKTWPCSDGSGNTCTVLLASGAHPENVAVGDFGDLNPLDLHSLAGDAAIPTIEGARVFPDDGSVCGTGNVGGAYLMGPGDDLGGTVNPATPDDFLPTPATDYTGHLCGDDPSVLYRYNFVTIYSLDYEPYTGDPQKKRCPTPTSGMARQTGSVVVKRNANGTVEPCDAIVQKAPYPMDMLTSTDGKTFPKVDEQSTSADGRFIVINNGGGLVFSFNPTPRFSNTWSIPAPLSNMYQDLKNVTVTVAGKKVPATDVVPLALEPLRKADGALYQYGEIFAGAYPWLSADASEVFFEAIKISQKGGQLNGPTRAAFSVIGRLTGNVERHIDGFSNPDRGNFNAERGAQERENMRSPGLVPGLWNDWRNPAFALPLSKQRLIYPMMIAPIGAYEEVAFDSFASGADVLMLEMNELVVPDPSQPTRNFYDLTRTPDTSGHVSTGTFARNASIPEYLDCAARTAAQAQRDHDLKKPSCAVASPFFVSGKAAQFPPSGSLSVASSKVLRDFGSGLSLGFFIRQDAGANALSGKTLSVVSLPSAVSATMKQNDAGKTTLTFTLGCRSGDQSIDVPLFASPSDRDWKHVALTYDAVVTSTITAYVDGLSVATSSCGSLSGAAHTATDPLIVGPNLTGNSGTDVVYWIDELRLSRTERSAGQIAIDALVHTNVASADLPAGLAASLRLAPTLALEDPATYPDKVALGRDLFVDKRFSSTGKVACATCHAASSAFADPRGISLGLDGNPLPRSAPSIYNRAFGGVEMWDGARSSLESQATAPFLNPNEMGLTKDQLIATAKTNYKDRFVQLYGGTSQPAIADALAHYVRSLLSASSPLDSYLAGNAKALTASQRKGYDLFRGKARCIACHNGSDLTDEQFHRQGLSVPQAIPPPPVKLDAGLAGAACAPTDTACQGHFQGWFKTPSLRNIGLTAPYFRNSSAKSLGDVVAAYNDGASDLSTNHDSVMRPLNLSQDEQAQLVDFLANALTSADNRF